MSDAAQPGGRPGRPPRCEIDALRAKTWFWAVANRLHTRTGYALEKRFSPEKMQRENGITKRPCQYDKYRRGEHSPRPSLINKIDRELPGTAAYADHCFWRVAKSPAIGLDELHDHLASLRPEIVDLLFYRRKRPGGTRERRARAYPATFQRLGREGDWDALTACIGVIQEARHYGEDVVYQFYTKPTFAVFRRLISSPPLYEVSSELFAYLVRNFLNNPDGQQIQNNVRRTGIQALARMTTNRILLIEDLYLLKKFGMTPTACLHVAEPYLPADVLYRIDTLIRDGDWQRVRQLPEIRKLAKALKRWEDKQTVCKSSSASTGQ